jgi:hypothetical protein
VPRAAARGAPLIEQKNNELERGPVDGASFSGILEGSQRKIKKIHRRGAKDAEKFKSCICPDDSSGQMQGMPLPEATEFDLKDLSPGVSRR